MSIFKYIQFSFPNQSCQSCRHFQNDPSHIEKAYAGLTSMSSGFASVRDRDGFCDEMQLYLSAQDSCSRFILRRPNFAEGDG